MLPDRRWRMFVRPRAFEHLRRHRLSGRSNADRAFLFQFPIVLLRVTIGSSLAVGFEGGVVEIAASVVALLSPYLAQASGALVLKASEGVAVLVGDLYDLVRGKFDSDPDSAARGALHDLEKHPSDMSKQSALEDVLSGKAKADPKFAGDLAAALHRITHGNPVDQQFLTQVYGGEVGKIINIGRADTVNID
jgi:hypothetical protein